MIRKYLILFVFLSCSFIVFGQRPPQVTIIQPINGTVFSEEQIRLVYFVEGTAPKSAKILVDDKPIQLLTEDEFNIGQNTVVVDVPAHDCKITIIVQNEHGASVPAAVNLKRSEFIFKPTLYVLAIGVGKYENPELQLQFSAKDAIDFAQSMLRQQGLLYEKVELKILTDEHATAQNIRDGLQWLQSETTFRDIAMIFMAGHGINNNIDEFFFMPVNAHTDRINATCVGYTEIKGTIDAIGGKMVVFVDACHSGNVLGNNQRRAATFHQAISDLTEADKGTVVFTSSTGRQFSLENREWNNGAFTKALVEGLNGKADLFNRQTITVHNLSSYVTDRVKELTNGQQSPTIIIPSSVPDFPLAVLSEQHVVSSLKTSEQNKISAEEHANMCKTYLQQAIALSQRAKKIDKLKKANEFFTLAKECNPENEEIDFYMNENKKQIMKSIQKKNSDYKFTGYSADTRSLAGITFGKIKQKSVGWYFTTRLTPKLIVPYLIDNLNDDIYTINKSGQIMNSNGEILSNDGLGDKKHKINFNAALGITRRIHYPLWAYAGAGISWDSIISPYKTESSSTHYVKYTEKTKYSPMLDLGLMLKLGGISFSSGFRANSIKDCYFTFGLQICNQK